jgi:uncharacterized protein
MSSTTVPTADGAGRAATPEAHVRVMLRPVGTPIALGMAALMIGTTMLAGLELGWLEGMTEQRTVAFVALGAAFPLELLAAIFAFMARDALTGTGLGVFSTMWLVSGLTLITGRPGATNDALGMFQILGAIALVLLLLSAGRGRLVLGLVLACGCARLAVTGLYEIDATHGLDIASGIVGLVLGAASAYGIVALLMEDLPRRSLLPLGRSGRAASSVEGSFADQLDDLEHEAGVRRTL